MSRHQIVHRRRSAQPGFVALIFVLVMSAVMLSVAVAASLRSIENLQVSYWNGEGDVARQAAASCIEDGLLQLKSQWSAFSRALSVGGGSCTIQASVSPGQATLSAKGTVGAANHPITVTVSNTLAITSWSE